MPSVRLPAPVVAVRWLGEACRPPAGEEADRGELDLELKPGSSGDVAALASYNLSSERTLSYRTIFMRQNDW